MSRTQYDGWPAEKRRLSDRLDWCEMRRVPPRCRVECGDCGGVIYKLVRPHGQALAVVPQLPGDGVPRPDTARSFELTKTFNGDKRGGGTVRQRYRCPRRDCGFVRIRAAERVAEAYVDAVEAGRDVIVAGVDF